MPINITLFALFYSQYIFGQSFNAIKKTVLQHFKKEEIIIGNKIIGRKIRYDLKSLGGRQDYGIHEEYEYLHSIHAMVGWLGEMLNQQCFDGRGRRNTYFVHEHKYNIPGMIIKGK